MYFENNFSDFLSIFLPDYELGIFIKFIKAYINRLLLIKR